MTQKEKEEIFGKDDHGILGSTLVARVIEIFFHYKEKKQRKKIKNKNILMIVFK